MVMTYIYPRLISLPIYLPRLEDSLRHYLRHHLRRHLYYFIASSLCSFLYSRLMYLAISRSAYSYVRFIHIMYRVGGQQVGSQGQR